MVRKFFIKVPAFITNKDLQTTENKLYFWTGKSASNFNENSFEKNEAKQHIGPTIFDWLVEVIRNHCLGGSEEEDNAELILK